MKLVSWLLPPREISVSGFRHFRLRIERARYVHGPLKAIPASTGSMVVALQRQALPFFRKANDFSIRTR